MPWVDGDNLSPANLNNKSGLVYNVKDEDYGAVGDGVTDDTTAIQAALDACAADIQDASIYGGTVYVPPGVYGITAQLTVPNRVTMVGAGSRSAEIKAITGWPDDTALIRLGAAGAVVFNSMVERLSINCNNKSGSIGVYAEDIQDHCGLRAVTIRAFGAKGVFFDASAGTFGSINGYTLEDVETLTNSTSGTGIGFHIKGPHFWPGRLHRLFTECDTGTDGADGILFENGFFSITDGYAGWYSNGIRFGAAAYGMVIGFHGNFCTDVLQIDTSQVAAMGIARSGGTNAINDTVYAWQDTGTAVTFYASGRMTRQSDVMPQRTPAALSAGDNNDYNISGRGCLRLNANASGSTITGVVALPSGSMVRMINVSANTLSIGHQNTGSGVSNRIISPTGGDVTLAENGIADLQYDSTSSRWRITNTLSA